MNFGKLLVTKLDKYDENKYIKLYENIVIAKGGDGTLLRAINMYKDRGVPFWGINAGTIGFLMNTGEMDEFENIKSKSFRLIKVAVTYNKSVRDMASIGNKMIVVESEFQAFNDVMIGGDMNSWIHFDVKEKDDFFGKFSGGGMIFSTPQGSTGINKNNDGVILPLSSNLWSITGDKTSRQIEYVIKPRKMIINVESRTPVTVWVDGSNHIIKNVQKMEVTSGDRITVMFGGYNEFKKKRRI